MFVFRLDSRSGVPPYLQLVHQVRQAVLMGFLQPGDRLPLIREVVETLAINPNTVAKAYRQLEQEDLVTGRPGQGTFVNDAAAPAIPAAAYASLRHGLHSWLRQAYDAGLDEQAVAALFTTVHQDLFTTVQQESMQQESMQQESMHQESTYQESRIEAVS